MFKSLRLPLSAGDSHMKGSKQQQEERQQKEVQQQQEEEGQEPQ